MDLVVGKRYQLAKEIDVKKDIGGGYGYFAKELQENGHILIDKMELSYCRGDYLLTFKKEFPEEFKYPSPLHINTMYISHKFTNNAFVADEVNAAKIIQNLVRRKQIQRKTIEDLYAPDGPGYNSTLKDWERNLENQEVC